MMLGIQNDNVLSFTFQHNQIHSGTSAMYYRWMVIVFFGIKSGHIYRWHSRTQERIKLSPQYSVIFMSNYFQLKDGCVGKTNFTGNNENMMKFRQIITAKHKLLANWKFCKSFCLLLSLFYCVFPATSNFNFTLLNSKIDKQFSPFSKP